MDETMMNTVEEVIEETVEVKPVLSKGAVVFLASIVTGVVAYGIYRGVKAYKRHKANKTAEAEIVELTEDQYSEVENG